jgi:hypothetical protein
MKGRWRVVLGLVLSAAAIWLMLSRTNVDRVWSSILAANFPLLALSAAVATTIFPIRAFRWKFILQAVDPNLPFSLLWRATAIGFALNNSLPARLGEVARAYVLARGAPRVGFAAAFASLAVDRVFDAMVLIGFLTLGLMGLPAVSDLDARNAVYGSLLLMAVASGALLAGLLAMSFFPSRVIRVYQFFARRVAPSLEARGSAMLASFAAGLSALSHPKRFMVVLFWSVVHWLTNAVAFWIGFRALGIDVQNSLLAAITAQSVIAFAIALPQGPGGLGIFQASGVVALSLFGVSSEDAIAWGFAFWAFSFVPITSIGMVYFAQGGLSLRELRGVVQDFRGVKRSDSRAGSDV